MKKNASLKKPFNPPRRVGIFTDIPLDDVMDEQPSSAELDYSEDSCNGDEFSADSMDFNDDALIRQIVDELKAELKVLVIDEVTKQILLLTNPNIKRTAPPVTECTLCDWRHQDESPCGAPRSIAQVQKEASFGIGFGPS